MPKVRRQNLPPALFQHLLDRIESRRIPASQLEQLAKWLDTEPEVPEGQDPIETFLLAGQHAKGARVS